MKPLCVRLIFVCFFSVCQTIFAQQDKIVKFLNESLQKDLALPDTIKYFDDTLRILNPYKIENGILSVELEVRKGGYLYHEKREIPIDEVEMVEKDLNVILTGKNSESVTETVTQILDGKPQESKIYRTAYFQTGIRIGKKNKIIGEHLQFYFAKANRQIAIGQWYD